MKSGEAKLGQILRSIEMFIGCIPSLTMRRILVAFDTRYLREIPHHSNVRGVVTYIKRVLARRQNKKSA